MPGLIVALLQDVSFTWNYVCQMFGYKSWNGINHQEEWLHTFLRF